MTQTIDPAQLTQELDALNREDAQTARLLSRVFKKTDSMRAEMEQEIESDVLDAVTSSRFLNLNLSQIARYHGVPTDVVEQVAQTITQRHLGVDIEQLEFQSIVKQVEQIEQIQDSGMREWKLQGLARRCKRTVKQLMEAFNKALCQRNPIAPKHISQFKREHKKEIDWLVQGWIPKGVTLLLHAQGGCGKTLLVYHLLESILSGRAWNGYPVERGDALLVQVDEPELVTAERLDIRDIADDAPLYILSDWTIDSLHRLEAQIAPNPPKLLIIDSITAVNRNTVFSENDVEYARPILQIRDLARRYGMTVILIHHSNSEGRSRGTTAIHNSVDEVWGLSQVLGGDDRLLTVQKTRLGRPPGRYRFAFEEDFSFRYLGEQQGEDWDEEDPTLEHRIRLWLSEPAQAGIAFAAIEVSERLGINTHSARRTLREMWAKGLISRKRESSTPHQLYFVKKSEEAISADQADHPVDHLLRSPQPPPKATSREWVIKRSSDQPKTQNLTNENGDHADHLITPIAPRPQPSNSNTSGNCHKVISQVAQRDRVLNKLPDFVSDCEVKTSDGWTKGQYIGESDRMKMSQSTRRLEVAHRVRLVSGVTVTIAEPELRRGDELQTR